MTNKEVDVLSNENKAIQNREEELIMTNKETMVKLEVVLEKLDEVYDELDAVNSHLYNLNRSTVVSKDIINHDDRNYGGYDIGLSDDGIAWVNEMYEQGYVMAVDDDFEWKWGMYGISYRYTGDKDKFIIPMYINGKLVTSHEGMFSDFFKLDKLSIASNNPNVENTAYMFSKSDIAELDLSEYDTSSVTDMKYMFMMSKATELDLSGFNTSNVTDMDSMFSYTYGLENINLSGFDTSKVTTMRQMFWGSSATKLDLSGFDTSNVTIMHSMFERSSATELDLRSFDIGDNTLIYDMLRSDAIETVVVSTQEISDILSSEQYTPDNIDFKVINN